jgi:hypothetical protein
MVKAKSRRSRWSAFACHSIGGRLLKENQLKREAYTEDTAYDYPSLGNLCHTTHHTRMLPSASMLVRQARLPTTDIRSIDRTLLLHSPINKSQSQAFFPDRISGSKTCRASSSSSRSHFSFPFFTFMLLSRFTESVRGYPTHTRTLLLGSYRFLEATKASKTT